MWCLLTIAHPYEMKGAGKCMALPVGNETETIYLSGKGCDDTVEWDFYCTGGRESDKWTSIGVPSCWELQGFGTCQYGYEYNK